MAVSVQFVQQSSVTKAFPVPSAATSSSVLSYYSTHSTKYRPGITTTRGKKTVRRWEPVLFARMKKNELRQFVCLLSSRRCNPTGLKPKLQFSRPVSGPLWRGCQLDNLWAVRWPSLQRRSLSQCFTQLWLLNKPKRSLNCSLTWFLCECTLNVYLINGVGCNIYFFKNNQRWILQTFHSCSAIFFNSHLWVDLM